MSDKWCPENDGAYRDEVAELCDRLLIKRIKELEAQLAEQAEASEMVMDACLKAEAQLAAVRGLPEKWLQDSYLTVCCGLEVVKVNDMDREDCANELKVAIGDKS